MAVYILVFRKYCADKSWVMLGIRMPVIWTCRHDLIDQVHFDTRQYNHIVWRDSQDLQLQLKNRILAVLGEGPGVSDSS